MNHTEWKLVGIYLPWNAREIYASLTLSLLSCRYSMVGCPGVFCCI